CFNEALAHSKAQDYNAAYEAKETGKKCRKVGDAESSKYHAQAAQNKIDAQAADATAQASEAGGTDPGADPGTDPVVDSSGTQPAGGGNQLMGTLLATGAGLGALCLMGTICEKDKDKAGE